MGVTGQLGKLVAEALRPFPHVAPRACSRRKPDLPSLQNTYGQAVYLDLDDPRTFADALAGVDSIFLLTGYTVDMLVQSKAMVDSARRAGVKHIVHLGVFSQDENCYDAHFAWHQLIESYIKVSGISYTFLHPNCFLQNFTGFYGIIKDGKARSYTEKPLGWIALEDVAEATAKILSEGERHFSKEYWFSTEVMSVRDAVEIFNDVTGEKVVVDIQPASQFLKDFIPEGAQVDAYFRAVADFYTQFEDGRMNYIGTVRDDMKALFGRAGLSVRQWAELHKVELTAASRLNSSRRPYL
jgi:NAD(P)H dehydrogenase (quinone)